MSPRMLCAVAVATCALASASPAAAAPPSNDHFERATPLGNAPVQVAGTLDEATTQPGEPAHGVSTVWYAYRPAASGRTTAELVEGSNLDGQLSVYTGSDLSSLQKLVGATGLPARAPFEATAGQTYWIAVGSSYVPTASRFQLRIRPAPLPANDAFADAIRVRIPGEYTGVLADATGELGEPRHARRRSNNSVWFRLRARRTGKLTIDTVGSSCGAALAAYTGSNLTRLREVASSNGGPIRFVARRGRAYRIALNCEYPGLGDYVLTVSDGSIRGKGVTLEPDAGQTIESVRTGGLRVTIGAKRKVKVGIELRVRPATARALGLDSPVLGRVRGQLGYRQKRPAAIRLTAAARRALGDETSLSATVRVTLLQTSAPNRVLNVPLRIPN